MNGSANPNVTTWMNFKEPFEYIVPAKWLPDGCGLSVQTMPRLQTEYRCISPIAKTGAASRVLWKRIPAG